MCLVKAPKVAAPSPQDGKDPPILRNPYLDGLDPIIRARQTGWSALRVDRPASPVAQQADLSIPRAPTTPAVPPGMAAYLGRGPLISGGLRV